MSEGPEVKRTADKISEAILGKTIVDIFFKTLKDNIKENIIGSKVKSIDTYGKNIVISFTSGVYLHNHMMMWGKWRIYDKKEFDGGKSKPPPRRIVWSNQKITKNNNNKIDNNNITSSSSSLIHETVKDVRNDSRVRLILVTSAQVAVQFNGPILHFTMYDPSKHASIAKLGPDALKSTFDIESVRNRLHNRGKRKLADLLLDQTFVAGIGNKYKSEILFLRRLYPFRFANNLSSLEEQELIQEIPSVLKMGYMSAGRTRPEKQGEESNKWEFRHWVFRRAGRPCWVCGTKIAMDRQSSSRVTYWCPKCQTAKNKSIQ
jgi:endonuclease-8